MSYREALVVNSGLFRLTRISCWILVLSQIGASAASAQSSTCLSLDSALIYFSNNFQTSISHEIDALDYTEDVCFSTTEVAKLFLSQILRETPYNFRKAGRGYNIYFDKKKSLLIGQILSERQRTPVQHASIYAPELKLGVYANDKGRFRFLLNKIKVDSLVVSCVGFKTIKISLEQFRNSLPTIYLAEDNILPELLIDHKLEKQIYGGVKNQGETSIPLHLLYHQGSIMGQADILQYAKQLSAINGATDGVSALRVQGGSQDQNLILMNGVPVYHQSHGLGIHSIFNANAIGQATFHVGFLPSEYQGKLSSVLAVDMRQGDKENYHVRSDISPFGVNVAVDGPLIKNKLSFLWSGRYSNINSIRKKITPNTFVGRSDERNLDMKYLDANAGLHYQISDDASLEVGGYFSQDDFFDLNNYHIEQDDYYYYYESVDLQLDENYRWKNANLFVDFNARISKTYDVQIKPYISNFQYESENNELEHYTDSSYLVGTDFLSTFTDKGIKVDFTSNASNFSPDKIGVHFSNTRFTPGVFRSYTTQSHRSTLEVLKDQIVRDTFDEFEESSSEFMAYLEKSFEIGQSTHIKFGLSTLFYSRNSFSGIYPQPRFSIIRQWRKNFSSQLTASLTRQQKHLLSSSNNGHPSDLGVPASDLHRPELSTQLNLNNELTISSRLNFRVSIFYKSQKNIITLPESGFSLDNSQTNIDILNWEELAIQGERQSYGSAFDIKYKAKKIDLNASYTYGKSNDKFENYLESNEFPNLYHRDHQLTSSIIWRPFKNFSVTPLFTLASANVLTLPAGDYSIYRGTDEDFIEFITASTPLEIDLESFVRADLSINYLIPRKKTIHRFKGSVFNVFNRQNFSYYNYIESATSIGQEFDLFIHHGPRRIWSINYSLSF